MVAHKAAFDAGEVECLVILVVIILGAEMFVPVAGHILLEESYKVFEKFEAVRSQFIAEFATGDDDVPVGVVAYTLAVLPETDINIQTSFVNTDADAVLVPHNTARIPVTIFLAEIEIYFPMQKCLKIFPKTSSTSKAPPTISARCERHSRKSCETKSPERFISKPSCTR